MNRELLQQCLDLITALDKDGVICELGLILELRDALGIPDKLKMKAKLAKQTALDKKADNACELGLDYESEQEPAGWFDWDVKQEVWVQVYPNTHGQPLYTAPLRKEWVSLTDEQLAEIFMQAEFNDFSEKQMYGIVEAKLKEKNT